MTSHRYSIHAYEARLDRHPDGPLGEPWDPACCECEDSGMTDCGCMSFEGPLDDCTACHGDGAVWCDCAAGERRAAAWERKAKDYYTRDYSVCEDEIAF